MAQVLLLLNHFLQFFLMPLAWAALFCLATQCLFRTQVRASGKSWRQRWLLAGGLGCAFTVVMLLLNGGQSSMAYYGLLGALFVACEVWQLKLWKA